MIQRSTFMAALLAVAFAATVHPQGSGLIESSGFLPRVDVSGVEVLLPSTLSVENLAPSGTAPTLVILASAAPGAFSLAPLGFPGILGIDVASPSFAMIGPFSVGAATWTLPFVPPAALAGTTLYLQAAQADSGAPGGGLALSLAVPATFGHTADTALASVGATPQQQTLLSFFADGQTVGPTLPILPPFAILDVNLAASFGGPALRDDVPVKDASDPARPRIRLPGGRSLYHYQDAAGRYGWFLVLDGGRRFEWLFDGPAFQGQDPFAALLSASPFEPYAAIMSHEALAGYGGAKLFLCRTDGQNVPGVASAVRPIPFTGALSGLNLQEPSLTFLQGALLFEGSASVARLSTSPGSVPALVPLPPSGGAVPVDVDSEFAFSADGSIAVLTAGATNNVRDVYSVYASGPAVNLTQSAGDYSSVGYQDPLEGGRLALDPPGSRVAYVKRVSNKQELFVMDTTPGSPSIQLTGPAEFENTIDQEVGVSLLSRTLLTFQAGALPTALDAYRVTLPQASSGLISVANVTGTSGFAAAPYGVGATLQRVALAGAPGGGVLYQMDAGAGTPSVLVQAGALAGSATVLANGVSSLAGAQPRSGAALLAINGAAGSQVLTLSATGTAATEFTAPAGQTLAGLLSSVSTGSALAVSTTPGGDSLTLLRTGLPALPVTGAATGIASRSAAFVPGGAALASVTSSGITQVFRVDGTTGAATPLGVVAGPVFFY